MAGSEPRPKTGIRGGSHDERTSQFKTGRARGDADAATASGLTGAGRRGSHPALATDDDHWVPVRKSFFLPVAVLGRLFRGKFLHALRQARRQGKLRGKAAALDRSADWKRLLDQLYQVDWVVYAKPPFGGPDQVFRYLGRYTHRVAIANHRLVALENGHVTFKVKNYADEGKKRQLTLAAGEFVRRFLLHVLPRGFVRIRHYGLLSARNVHTRLIQARELLAPESKANSRDPEPDADSATPWWKRFLRLTGIDVMLCPFCNGGRLVRIPTALPARWPP